jgi:hypothetical protein
MAAIASAGKLSATGVHEYPPPVVVFHTPQELEPTYIVFLSVLSMAIEVRNPTAPSPPSSIIEGPIETHLGI